jgi:Aspartyl protease
VIALLVLSAAMNTIAIEIRENLPLIEAKVDGVPVRLMFDLGDASALVLQQSVIDQIKAVPTGESQKLQDLKGTFEAPLYKVKRLQIGTAVFTEVLTRLETHHPLNQPKQIGYNGFMGTALLKPYEIVFDYPHRRMTIESSGKCKGTVVPFLLETKWRGEPVTEVETDLGRAIIWWDTGAQTSMLRSSFSETTRSQANSPMDTKRLILGGTNFGPWQFQIIDASLPGFDGLIGYHFFAKHIVCVDFPGNRLRISR